MQFIVSYFKEGPPLSSDCILVVDIRGISNFQILELFSAPQILNVASSSYLLLYVSNPTLEKILHMMTESTANMEKSCWGKYFEMVFTQCKWALPTKMLSHFLGF